MHKLKNNMNRIIIYLKFFIVSIGYLFILYYIFEKLSGISINNLFINSIYYILLLVMVLTGVIIGFKFIFKHINPFGEILYITGEKRRRHVTKFSVILILAIIIDRNIPYNAMESDFIRLLLKSCFTIIFLFIYVIIIKKSYDGDRS